jgi:tetratricopeptide (TPR) repeat protein
MPLLFGLLALFTVWMAFEAVHRGRDDYWLWIIVFFGPLGALAFFVTEYFKEPFEGHRFRPPKVTAEDARAAEAEAHRLGTAGAWAECATAFRARRSFGRAADAARLAVERDPASLDARYELGLALFHVRQYGDAIGSLTAVVEKDARFDSDRAPLTLAEAQGRTGDLKAARETLERLAARSGRPEVLFDLAIVQKQQGDRTESAETLRRLIREAEAVPAYLQRDFRDRVRQARRELRRLAP